MWPQRTRWPSCLTRTSEAMVVRHERYGRRRVAIPRRPRQPHQEDVPASMPDAFEDLLADVSRAQRKLTAPRLSGVQRARVAPAEPSRMRNPFRRFPNGPGRTGDGVPQGIRYWDVRAVWVMATGVRGIVCPCGGQPRPGHTPRGLADFRHGSARTAAWSASVGSGMVGPRGHS